MPIVIILGAMGAAALLLYYAQQNGGIILQNTTDNSTGDTPSGEPDPSTAVGLVDDGAGDPISIALPIIQQFEGFSASAYEDPPGSGKYSIGYGHQIRPGDPYTSTSTVSQSEAQDVLRVDVGAAWTCVYQSVKVNCTPNQYAAMISLCFNIGCAAFKGSTLVRDLNDGDTAGAAAQFPAWNKAGGEVSDDLIARRAQEQQLFQGVAA